MATRGKYVLFLNHHDPVVMTTCKYAANLEAQLFHIRLVWFSSRERYCPKIMGKHTESIANTLTNTRFCLAKVINRMKIMMMKIVRQSSRLIPHKVIGEYYQSKVIFETRMIHPLSRVDRTR